MPSTASVLSKEGYIQAYLSLCWSHRSYCKFCHALVHYNKKHTYSNILKILQPKKETFQIKNSDIFHIYAQNIDCGYSLELPQ